MALSVIIPWSAGCAWREANLDFIREWWQDCFPTAEIIVAEPDMSRGWIKARAVSSGLGRATHEIAVVADADCLCEGLPAAVKAVRTGKAKWAIPHRRVFRLTEEGTDLYMRTGEYPNPFDRRPYTGFAGGGFVVARREVMLSTPMDFRFTGWG